MSEEHNSRTAAPASAPEKVSLWQKFRRWPLIARIATFGCGGFLALFILAVVGGACLAIMDPEGTEERAQQAEDDRAEQEEQEEADRQAEEEAEREADEQRQAEAEREAEEEREREEAEAEAERLEGMAEVPGVEGMPADEARDALEDLGFSVDFETDTEGGVWDASNWVAVSTDPDSGELIEDDSDVVVNVTRPEDEEAEEEDDEELAQEEAEEEQSDFTITQEGGDGWSETTVEFDIADNFTMNMIRNGARRDTLEAIEEALEEHPDSTRIVIEGSFPMTDQYGNTEDSVILRVFYDRETVDQINFDNVMVRDTIWEIRDGGMIHPELQE
ncbi:PASTA domain-containing protein [Nesterenkonia natronophila]|uniref:PASTA domain-containing protein n=1 Tax=Nesterenkonia natronophila TaxID=2174932 RepID=A0A3A4F5C0_9MICC|nr:PASTA domain-containing protein [Nesterenkonia natronophila]RJN32931.1 PASTA domain-containing protein [Nesterenkonia natronophila]